MLDCRRLPSVPLRSSWDRLLFVRAYCHRNMNPYAPPTFALPQTPQPQRIDLKNPARFLLYPLAAICIFFSLTMGARYLLNGFKFRTVDFLNAGLGVLEVLFGISAFLLATRGKLINCGTVVLLQDRPSQLLSDVRIRTFPIMGENSRVSHRQLPRIGPSIDSHWNWLLVRCLQPRLNIAAGHSC